MKSEIFKNSDKQMIREEESLFNDNLLQELDKGFQLSELDDCYLAEIDATGMDKKDFKINVEDRVLYIHGEHKEESVKKEEDYNCKEVKFRSFQQSFLLPENAEEDSIDVRMKNDKLIVKIFKKSHDGSYFRKYLPVQGEEDVEKIDKKKNEETFGDKLGKLWEAIKNRFSNKER
jgi:HSP20 family protein